MIDGNIVSTTSLRTKFIESIPFDFEQEQFILCHNSFIVNMNQIKTIRDSEFIMFNNKSVPISRRLLKKVKEKYVQYLVGE
jgi:DNA-binding LytR/AlgR family response regulator